MKQDVLVALSENPTTRKLGAMVGVPLPQGLKRAKGPWREAELSGVKIAVGGGAALRGLLRSTLLEAGGELVEVGSQGVDALVFDASEILEPSSLGALHEFFHPAMSRLSRNGRVVVVAKRSSSKSSAVAAAQAALDGFVRSVAKEIGRRGSTANLIWVGEGAEARIAPVLRFLLSARSAFVTAQPLWVTTAVREVGQVPFEAPLAGKVALVTGAANGIGAATARALAREGAKVLCVDRPNEDQRLNELAGKLGNGATPVLVNLADAGAGALLAQAVEAAGGIDIVVHNAGITRDKTLAKMSSEQWQEVITVNLMAAMRVHAALSPHLRDEGRVVCLSSVGGIAGNVGQTNYAASKAGLLGWIAAESGELAARGVAINAVAPGFIETRMVSTMPLMVREAARRLSALNQGGRPEDVAEAITFLVSPGAHGLTGRHLRVCGGAFIGA
jgi:3-oxoacyl-[acyl-carrier protein] reductase